MDLKVVFVGDKVVMGPLRLEVFEERALRVTDASGAVRVDVVLREIDNIAVTAAPDSQQFLAISTRRGLGVQEFFGRYKGSARNHQALLTFSNRLRQAALVPEFAPITPSQANLCFYPDPERSYFRKLAGQDQTPPPAPASAARATNPSSAASGVAPSGSAPSAPITATAAARKRKRAASRSLVTISAIPIHTETLAAIPSPMPQTPIPDYRELVHRFSKDDAFDGAEEIQAAIAALPHEPRAKAQRKFRALLEYKRLKVANE
ncbi:hypothetical protein DFJ74DRAFT_640025 [Hyaloraphidium curvatum]|nr:hypothetical protein DFJ74DRAFT_640025 [Hyaloraphidium curvatum]